MSKTIGIPGWVIEGKYFGVTIPYMRFAEQFGKVQIITRQDINNAPKVDLLILPGGADILPMTYGLMPDYMTGSPNVMLELFDEKLLPTYIENDTPILGIN